jgi:hypothetical protein
LNPIKRWSIEVELEQSPQPWYKSKTALASWTSTVIGLAVATGVISPENGSILTGHLEPILGGIVALLGLVSVWGHGEVTKVASPKGQGPVTVSVPPAAAAGAGLTPDTSKHDPFMSR